MNRNFTIPASILALCMLLAALPQVAADKGSNAYAQEVLITPLLKTDRTNIGQEIRYPNTDQPEVSIVRVVLPPGANTGWHAHPVHTYAVILQGELTLRKRDDQTLVFRVGDAFAEMVDVVHRGENHGHEPVELIMFVTGEKRLPVTVPANDQ